MGLRGDLNAEVAEVTEKTGWGGAVKEIRQLNMKKYNMGLNYCQAILFL